MSIHGLDYYSHQGSYLYRHWFKIKLGCVLTWKKKGLVGFSYKGVNYGNTPVDLKAVHLLIYVSKGDYGCVWSYFVKRGIEGHMQR